MKDLFQSKTFWANFLALIVGVAAIFGIKPNAELVEQIVKIYAIAMPLLNTFLRTVTNEEIVSIGGIPL